MAFSLETIRGKILVSKHGRRLGLTQDDYLCGFKDSLLEVTNATSSTTATAINPYGLTSLVTSTNDTWKLTDPPYAGIRKQLTSHTTSTGIHTVDTVAAVIYSTAGTTQGKILFNGVGESVSLVAMTTAAWVVIGQPTCAFAS